VETVGYEEKMRHLLLAQIAIEHFIHPNNYKREKKNKKTKIKITFLAPTVNY